MLIANHKPGVIYVRGNKISIERGQVGWSIKKLSVRWGWSRKRATKFLFDLEKEQQIEQQKNNITTLITIVNYEQYQQKEPQRVQQRNTNKNVKKSKNVKKKEYTSESDEFRLSEFLLSLILERKPDFKKPNLQTWAIYIDRMIRLDKRKPERIREVIQWCQHDSFWQDNVLSTKKLREKFDQLEMKMNKGDSKHGSGKIRQERTFDKLESKVGTTVNV